MFKVGSLNAIAFHLDLMDTIRCAMGDRMYTCTFTLNGTLSATITGGVYAVCAFVLMRFQVIVRVSKRGKAVYTRCPNQPYVYIFLFAFFWGTMYFEMCFFLIMCACRS